MESSSRMVQTTQLGILNSNRKRITVEDFITTCNGIHNNLYDYSEVKAISWTEKIPIICKKHGIFLQLANDHKRGRGCTVCAKEARRIANTDDIHDFIKKANEKHQNKYNYSDVVYCKGNEKVNIKCLRCKSIFKQTPSNHLQGSGCMCYVRDSKSTRITTSDFIEAAKQIHSNNNYNYDDVEYVNSKVKVQLHCTIHGVFKITPNAHLSGVGCPACGQAKSKLSKVSNNAAIITDRISAKHKNIKIDASDYRGVSTCMMFTCIKHGNQYDTPINLLNRVHACTKCKPRGSSHEQKICDFLTENNIKFVKHYKIKHANRTIEIDIYIEDKQLGIEINGIYFHSEKTGNKNKSYHLNKTNICKENNIRLLHFYDTEINDKFDIVKSKILSTLNMQSQRIYARKTTAVQITKSQKREFLDKNHIQGNDRSQLFFGLVHNNEIVAVITFGKRQITRGAAEWELIRYASKNNTTVVGGFSKILAHALPHLIMHGAKILITYADIRLSNGNLYKKTGFLYKHNSVPCYWYFRLPEGKLYHRSNFMKHKLSKKLAIFDDTKTEWQNMSDNEYDRVWDCGQMVFVKHLL